MEYQNRQIASDVYMGVPDNEYKVSSERYLLDFKNIEAEDVVFIFLNMMDNWLRTIITSLDKKERLRKLERFLYRWNIWTETNLEIDNPFYLYDMLSDMSVSSNTTELFVNFKKLYCVFTKCSIEQSSYPRSESELVSIYLCRFISLIVENLDTMSIICEYKNTLLDSDKYEKFFSGISKNSNKGLLSSSIKSNTYNQIDVLFRNNDREFLDLYSGIVEMGMALRKISEEMNGDIGMIHSIATMVLEKSDNSSEIARRDVKLFLKSQNRVYLGVDKHLNSVFLNNAITNVMDISMNSIRKKLKKLTYPPLENMYRILSEVILIPPKMKISKDGKKVDIETDELRRVFIRMYQSAEIRGNIEESFLSNYVKICVNYKNSELYKNVIEPRINDTSSKVNMYSVDNNSELAKYIALKIQKRD